jgi:hypothetical protein
MSTDSATDSSGARKSRSSKSIKSLKKVTKAVATEVVDGRPRDPAVTNQNVQVGYSGEVTLILYSVTFDRPCKLSSFALTKTTRERSHPIVYLWSRVRLVCTHFY